MAKRYNDSRKYNDPWFRKLSPKCKCFWDYMLSTCDHAGFWKVDFELASFCVGEEITETDVREVFSNRVVFGEKDKWFIPGFVDFQYGELDANNRVHNSVLQIIRKEQGSFKGRLRVVNDRKDYEIYKDMDKDNIKHFNILWDKYPRKDGRKEAFRHYEASIKTDTDKTNIETALKNYIGYLHKNKTEEQYIKKGSTWFNNWQDWTEYESTPEKKERLL